MPRANRYIVSGCSYHITHRCHDRSFLFRFAKDRNTYQSLLRSHVTQFPVALLGYCITSNHVHLLVRVLEGAEETLSRFMKAQEGQFAQHYNLRKKRKGAFWSDRYHAVMIDSGSYLTECLAYIDLNMVRAGAVDHPRDWEWCGYRELAGLKKRNRLITQQELLSDGMDLEDFREHYLAVIEQKLMDREFSRQSKWTESLAVGSEAFATRMKSQIQGRMKLEQDETHIKDEWVLKESPSVYCAFQG